jgi:chemotaxis signal transduction protein
VSEPHQVAAVDDVDPADGTSHPPSGTDVVVVRLGAGRFAVSLASVAEVGRVPAVTRVPGVPGWVAGVANWRGRILPVLDLRSLLGGDDALSLGDEARLTVLIEASVAVGVLVDVVEGTSTLTEVAAFPAASAPIGVDLLSGQTPTDDGPIAVLDVSAVMRLNQRLPQGRRTA